MRQRARASILAPWLSRFAPVLAVGLALSSCRVGPPAVTPAVVTEARATWPQATPWSLDQGRALFMDRCERCHGLPRPASQSPKAWPGLMDKMGNRAGMTREEKRKVLEYLMASAAVAQNPPSAPTSTATSSTGD